MNTPTPSLCAGNFSNRAGVLAALALVVSAAIGFRLATLPREPLWLDELHTAWVASGPAGEVAERARLGNQSPLYFWGVWGIAQVAGVSAFSLRALSLVAGVLVVPAVFHFTYRGSNSAGAALFAALLVACDEHCIFFAQEARPYALVQLLAVIAACCLLQALERGNWYWRMAFVFACAALLHVHATAAFVVVALALAGALLAGGGARDRSEAGYSRLQLASDLILIFLAWLPALPQLREIAGRRYAWWSFIETPTLSTTLGLLPLVPCVAVLGAMALSARGLRRPLGEFRRREAWLLSLIWWLIPLGLVVLATLANVAPLFHRRYVAGALVAPAITAAMLLAGMPNRSWARVAGLATILAAIFLNGFLASAWRAGGLVPNRNQNWEAAIHWLNEEFAGHGPGRVFLFSGLVESNDMQRRENKAFAAYLKFPVRGPSPLACSDEQIVPLPNDLSLVPSVQAAAGPEETGGTWLLALADGATADLLAAALGAPLDPKAHLNTFGDVLVVRLR